MKYDINLLHKRKTKKYSGKKWAAILIGIAFFAGGLYAGITFPSEALETAIANSQDLEGKVIIQNATTSKLDEKTIEFDEKLQRKKDLEAIDSTKSDVSVYLQTIEDSLPTDANIEMITISEDKLDINGVAKNDAVVAMFCIKLRENSEFEHVYVNTSTSVEQEETTKFNLSAQLPSDISGFMESQVEQDSTTQDDVFDVLSNEYTNKLLSAQEDDA